MPDVSYDRAILLRPERIDLPALYAGAVEQAGASLADLPPQPRWPAA